MDRRQAIKVALQAMDKWLDPRYGWRFAIEERTVDYLGLCDFDRGIIYITGWYIDLNSEVDVTDTILHEIAHALAGYDAGHGPVWQTMCRRVGANPHISADRRRINRMMQFWAATCDICEQERCLTRKPTRHDVCSCCEDAPPLRFQRQPDLVIRAAAKMPNKHTRKG